MHLWTSQLFWTNQHPVRNDWQLLVWFGSDCDGSERSDYLLESSRLAVMLWQLLYQNVRVFFSLKEEQRLELKVFPTSPKCLPQELYYSVIWLAELIGWSQLVTRRWKTDGSSSHPPSWSLVLVWRGCALDLHRFERMSLVSYKPHSCEWAGLFKAWMKQLRPISDWMHDWTNAKLHVSMCSGNFNKLKLTDFSKSLQKSFNFCRCKKKVNTNLNNI